MFENKDYELYLGDCLEVMDKLIEQEIKVDMVLIDPPYEKTRGKWDVIIPINPMWERINKLIKKEGVVPMIQVFCARRGSGKTKRLIELANHQQLEAKGDSVYIDDDSRPMLQLNRSIRFITE